MEIFDWKRMIMGDLPHFFLIEVVFRTIVMFVILLFTMRIAGKRSVKQLSIFETVIIIALGSAAGDPMFYEEVGILPAILVFITVITLYKLVTHITAKFKWFERLIEGKTDCLIIDGRFSSLKIYDKTLGQDEFFCELRVQNIEHLGQVRRAYIETSGQISVFYFSNDEVRYGLPLLPELYSERFKTIEEEDHYACAICGNVEVLPPGTAICRICQHEEWVKALKTVRIC